MSFHVPEQYRFKDPSHILHSDQSDGNNGLFIIPQGGFYFQCIASNGMGWEHVSITLRFKKSTNFNCPSWEEMCYIKLIFWDDEDVVMQLHPKKSEYVNNHPYTLHLWRPIDQEIPTPLSIMVGFK